MVDLAMLQVVRDLVAIFGVIAGLSYYVMTVRNAIIARKTQVVLNMSNNLFGIDQNRISIQLMSMQWKDFDDFRRKYDSTVDPDNFAKRWYIWQLFENLGYMLHQGIVDIETIYNLIGGFIILQYWQKYEPIIKEQRKFYNEPHWFRWWEYLVSETSKLRVELGLPETLTRTDVYSTEY